MKPPPIPTASRDFSPPPGYHISWNAAARIPVGPAASADDKRKREMAVNYLAWLRLQRQEKKDMDAAVGAAKSQLGVDRLPSETDAERQMARAVEAAAERIQAMGDAVKRAGTADSGALGGGDGGGGDEVGEGDKQGDGDGDGEGNGDADSGRGTKRQATFGEASGGAFGAPNGADAVPDCSTLHAGGVVPDDLAVRCTGRHIDGRPAHNPV